MTSLLQNDQLTVLVDSHGAEVVSMKKGDTEYVWSGQKEIWGRHAPILFPIIGKLKEGRYTYRGREYELSQHGFLRDMELKLVYSDLERVTYQLKSDESTLAKYPFQFEVLIQYVLSRQNLLVSYKILNRDVKPMLFSIGAHPGFNCPIDSGLLFTDYYLEFEKEEELISRRLIGGLVGSEYEYITTGKRLKLSRALFEKDALIFENLTSSHVTLQSDQSNRKVKISLSDFERLGIWTKEGSPFLCIEPWNGIADAVHSTGMLDQKEGIISLEQDGEKEYQYQIEIE